MLEKKIMLGKTELSNRLVMAPLCLDKSDRGSVSQKMLTHYDERTEAGYFSDLSSAVKREVSIPVILAGGVKTRRDAEMLLAGDKADLISVGRALAADSSWAVKAMAENV